jgi:hypothetical protein
MAEIRADTEALVLDRMRLLDDTRETAALLDSVASEAALRLPGPEQAAEAAAVVAVEPGDVAAKRRPRASGGVTRLPAKSGRAS